MPNTRSVYRVNYYDNGGTVVHANVLAMDSASAAAFIGATETLNVVEIAANVEVVGVDSPHPKMSARPATLTPLMPGWGLTRDEVARIKTLVKGDGA